MPWTAGFEQENGSGNTVWAEHTNHIVMAARGNYVVNPTGGGCAVTQNSPSADKTVDVAAGDVFNNGVKRTIGAAGVDLTSAYTGMTGTQRRYVFIFVNSSGTLTSSNGAIAASGSQEPPSYPEDGVVLAMITIAADKADIENSDIEDWRLEGPQGALFNGNTEVVGNLDVSGSLTFGSGSLSVTGNVSATGSLTSASTNFITASTAGNIADTATYQTGTVAFNTTSSSPTESTASNLLAVAAHQIGVIKDDVKIGIEIGTYALTTSGIAGGTLDVRFDLMINNGTGFSSVANTTYTVPSGAAENDGVVANLVWDISSAGKYVSDDFGDDISIKVQTYRTATTATAGSVSFNYDLSNNTDTNGIDTRLWDQVLTSTTSDATILSRS